MPNKTNKYINQSNKYAISQYLFNRKNTATKTSRTPSQSKEDANQNTKYAISIKKVHQPKHQIHHLNQKSPQPKHQVCHLNQKNHQPIHQVRHLNQKSTPT